MGLQTRDTPKEIVGLLLEFLHFPPWVDRDVAIVRNGNFVDHSLQTFCCTVGVTSYYCFLLTRLVHQFCYLKYWLFPAKLWAVHFPSYFRHILYAVYDFQLQYFDSWNGWRHIPCVPCVWQESKIYHRRYHSSQKAYHLQWNRYWRIYGFSTHCVHLDYRYN